MSEYSLTIKFNSYHDFMQFIDYKKKFDEKLNKSLLKSFNEEEKTTEENRGKKIKLLHEATKKLREEQPDLTYKTAFKLAVLNDKNK